MMRAGFKLLLFALAAQACTPETLTCKLFRAKSGYIVDDTLRYDTEYLYTFEGTLLAKVENLSFDTHTVLSKTEFEYDANGRISRESTEDGSALKIKDYEYGPNWIRTTDYFIVNSDTLVIEDEQYFYLENPEDNVYHDAYSNASYKFMDGNVVEYGYYEVSGTDTTDTFVEQYTYDLFANYYHRPEYRAAIPSDYLWATITSKNNLIRAQSIGPGFDFPYQYLYDTGNNLRRHVGKSGITVDFDLVCN